MCIISYKKKERELEYDTLLKKIKNEKNIIKNFIRTYHKNLPVIYKNTHICNTHTGTP